MVAGGLLFLAMAVLAAYTAWDNHRIVLRHYDVHHPDVPAAFDGFRIVFISDLEGRRFGPRQADLVERVIQADPDLILLGGDYVDESAPSAEPVRDLVALLRSQVQAPIYFVMGDKDFFVEGTQEPSDALARTLEALGTRWLMAPQRLERGGEAVWLTPLRVVGFNEEEALQAYLRHHPETPPREVTQLRRGTAFMIAVRPSDFVIVVQHEPLKDFASHFAVIQRLTAESRGEPGPHGTMVDHDLYIAGHTHGGQVRLPLIGPLVEPNRGFFPGNAYVKGAFVDADGRYQVVGAGLGASGPHWARFRFLNPPEVVVITLRRNGTADR